MNDQLLDMAKRLEAMDLEDPLLFEEMSYLHIRADALASILEGADEEPSGSEVPND